MVQERVTRQELREMRIGQTCIFVLSDAKKIASARVTAHQLKDEEGKEYSVKMDYQAKCVSITRKR